MRCRRWNALGSIIAGLLATPLGQAQSSDPTVGLEAVEITGSRLRRVDSETPAPVQVITRKDIERSGAASVGEVLQKLPANNAGSFNENGGSGAASVSLRGLGVQSTLVLINGRRVAPFGFPDGNSKSFVDLSQIPVVAIDRIEVLLDGASALYGSDAIAGVVNVILRRDYRGAEAKAAYVRSTHGDATAREAALTLGGGVLERDGFNAFVSYSHADQNPVLASAREHSRSVDYRPFGLDDQRSDSSYPGNLFLTDNTTFLQPLANCVPLHDAGSPLDGRCVYDQAQHQDIIVGSRRDSLFAAGTAVLGGGLELFADATLSRTAFREKVPNLITFAYFAMGVLADPFIRLPVGHPQNPYPFEVALRYRFAEEPLVFEPVNDTQRVVVGLRKHDLGGWDAESGLLYSHARTSMAVSGLVDNSVLTSEVLDGDGRARTSFIFGNPGANDPGLISRLYPHVSDVSRTTTLSIDLRGSRDILKLPAGPVGLAIGSELRREQLATALDPLTTSGSILFHSGADSAGARNVAALYAELSVPVLRSLETSLAARVDRYSDFGTTINPKLGLKWKVMPSLAVRATYASAFRAPALTETSNATGTGLIQVRDPKNCAVPDPANPSCEQFVDVFYGNNANLKPERARSLTAGFVVQPAKGVSLSVDAFRIDRRNEISYLQSDYLLAHESDFPGFVIRNPDGSLKQLDIEFANLGSTTVAGVDVDAKASTLWPGLGRVGAAATYEWLPHFAQAATKDSPKLEYAGTYLQPKSRAHVVFDLAHGPWQFALTFNYTGSYERAFTPTDSVCPYSTTRPELCQVKSWLTTELYVGYRPLRDFELGLLVSNLDNVQAPFDERRTAFIYTAYQSVYHSAQGRSFKLTGTYTFR